MKIYATQLSGIQLQEATQPRAANTFMVVKGSQHRLVSEQAGLIVKAFDVKSSRHALISDEATISQSYLPVQDTHHNTTSDQTHFTGKHNGVRYEKVDVVFEFEEPFLRYGVSPNNYFDPITITTAVVPYAGDLQVDNRGTARLINDSPDTHALCIFQIVSGLVSDVQTARAVIKVDNSAQVIAPRLAVRYTASTGYQGWFYGGLFIALYRLGPNGDTYYIASLPMTNLHTGDVIELNIVSTKLEAVLNNVIIASAEVSIAVQGAIATGLPAIGGFWADPSYYGFTEAGGGTWYIDLDAKDSTHANVSEGPHYTKVLPITDSRHQLKSEIVGWTESRTARFEKYQTTFPWDEDPIQEGIWPNHAWDNQFPNALNNPVATASGVAHGNSYFYNTARCAYVSGTVRSNQYSKGIAYVGSSIISRFVFGVRMTELNGYIALAYLDGVNTQIHYVSGNDVDLIGNPFTTSPIITGTELEFRVVDNKITLLVDGSAAKTVANSAFPSGVPIFGFILTNPNHDQNVIGLQSWEGGTYSTPLGITDSKHELNSDKVSLQIFGSGIDTHSSQHAHTVDQVTIPRVRVSLDSRSTTHSHTVESTVLDQLQELIAVESTHRHTVDEVLLTAEGTIVFRDSHHVHTSEEVVFYQQHELIVHESTHAVVSDNVGLLQIHTLQAKDSKHSLTTEKVTVEKTGVMLIGSSRHTFVSDFAELVEKGSIEVRRSSHEYSTGGVTLEVHQLITPKDSRHASTSKLVTISLVTKPFTSTHAHSVDKVTLRQKLHISVGSSHHILTTGEIYIWRSEPVVEREFVVMAINERILKVSSDATREITVN